MVSIHVLATPINGLRRSASVNPTALNMGRAGARSPPSVIPRLRCLRSILCESVSISMKFKSLNLEIDCEKRLHQGWDCQNINKNGEPALGSDLPPPGAHSPMRRMPTQAHPTAYPRLQKIKPAPRVPAARLQRKSAEAAPTAHLRAHASPRSSVRPPRPQSRTTRDKAAPSAWV